MLYNILYKNNEKKEKNSNYLIISTFNDYYITKTILLSI